MLKKKDIAEGVIQKTRYPNESIVITEEGQTVRMKNGIEGERVRFRVTKKRETHLEARLLDVLERSPKESAESGCGAFPACGGCLYQYIPYEEQLRMKEAQLTELLAPVAEEAVCDGILASPKPLGYRNKMEFSFGNDRIGGPLLLGMHKRGTTYDIVMADTCTIVDASVRLVVKTVHAYCLRHQLPPYHKTKNNGYLRHLLVRRSEETGELLLVLVTTSEIRHSFRDLAEKLLSLNVPTQDGEEAVRFAGIIHGINDLPADTVQYQSAELLYGKDYLTDRILGLTFKVSVFSFFQTNTRGAEILYGKVRDYLRSFTDSAGRKPVLYDLYSGTGTIAQIVSPEASHVYGVEIVEEAVEAAKENAARNGIENCTFLCGDVLKMLDEIPEKPDYIILDPPREGIVPKALAKIMRYEVPHMIYISCKATSFVRDMTTLRAAGWRVERYAFCDLFPQTVHVETVVLLGRKKDRDYISIPYEPKEGMFSGKEAEKKGTYGNIQNYVQSKYGCHVSHLNIAQVKRKHGIIERENYNKGAEGHKVPECTKEKERMIEEALEHFKMIETYSA